MDVRIRAQGHKHVRAEHQSTWQLTTEEHLSPRGDCIIAVDASMAAQDLPQPVKQHLRQGGKVDITLQVDDQQFIGTGYGHPDLDLSHATDMVFRRSDYTCNRTVTIGTSFTATDIPRAMISRLQDPHTTIGITLELGDMEE